MYDPDAGRHLQWGNKRILGSLAPSPTGPLPTSFDGRIMLLWKSRDRYRHVVMHKRRVFPPTMQFRIRNAREHYLYPLTIGRRVRRNFLPSSYDKKEPRTSCPGLTSRVQNSIRSVVLHGAPLQIYRFSQQTNPGHGSSTRNEREDCQRISVAQRLIQGDTLAVYKRKSEYPFANTQMIQSVADTGTLRKFKLCVLESPDAKAGKELHLNLYRRFLRHAVALQTRDS